MRCQRKWWWSELGWWWKIQVYPKKLGWKTQESLVLKIGGGKKRDSKITPIFKLNYKNDNINICKIREINRKLVLKEDHSFNKDIRQSGISSPQGAAYESPPSFFFFFYNNYILLVGKEKLYSWRGENKSF